MKKVAVIVLPLLLVVALVFGFNYIKADDKTKDESQESKIVATVNSEDLTLEQLNKYAGIDQITTNLSYMIPDFADVLKSTEAGEKLLDEYRKVKLDDLIKQVLLNQEAEKSNITDQEKDNFFASYVSQIKEQNQLDDEALLSNLQQQGYDSLDEFKEYIFDNGAKVAILQKNILADVSVGDEEIESYYNENQEYFKDDKDETAVKPLDEVKDDIKSTLMGDKKQKEWDNYVDKLQEKAEIKKYI